MSKKRIHTRQSDIDQSGAALVTVIMISFMLLTACVAMLTAVGANSRNTSDVLSETKAYYVAESGLQATVNVLRNRIEGDSTRVTYREAVNDPDLSTWLPYNYPTSGTATRAVVGESPGTYSPNSGSAYSVVVSDPDNSAVLTRFTTVGGLAPATGANFVASRTYGTSPNTTTITYSGIAPTTITHPDVSELLGNFQVTNAGSGAVIANTGFRIDYTMTLPREATVSIIGEIRQGATAGTYRIHFYTLTPAGATTVSYPILGGTVVVTGLTAAAKDLVLPTNPGVPVSTPINSVIGPVAPYRLKVVSTGFGPNGSVKQLEGIIRQNLLDGIATGAATSLIGVPCPVGEVCFAPGTSNGIAYNGCSSVVGQGCVPSFGLTDPTNLAYVQSHPPSGNPAQMTPPPALLGGAAPAWQASPLALDVLVDQLRVAAQNSGRYFVSPGGNLSNPGNFTAGTGITFCEGSCQVAGDGGGILVVTGMLTNVGGFSFRGMIIVTGEGGWDRNGGGNGQVIGNVVIAPYNRSTYVPENLSATFLPPRYQITGGGGSDVLYGDVTASFDNTGGVSDFIAGVAEK